MKIQRDERELHLTGEKWLLLNADGGVCAIIYDQQTAERILAALDTAAAEYKQPHELVAMAGHFYQMQGESYCDTPTDTWKLVPCKGYIKV